jgi:hypothetical protein
MGDSSAYSRSGQNSAYASILSAVDPARIQALLARATNQAGLQCHQPGHEQGFGSLEGPSGGPKRDSSQSKVASAVAAGLFSSISEYVNQGGALPSLLTSNSSPCVLIFVDGFDFSYQLTTEDLFNVFSRFGSVMSISVSQDGTNAIVTYSSPLHAFRAVSELNGQRMSSLGSCVLRVLPYTWGGMESGSPGPVPLIRKYTCRFDIQIENDKDFHVARRIIGQKGCNMKRIVKQAGFDAKLRLRGRGSGFLEGSQKQESQEPLHLCVSCKDYQGYKAAVDQVEELLQDIYAEYQQYCLIKSQPYPDKLRVLRHEHPLLYQPGALDMPLSPPSTPVEPNTSLLESLDIEHLIEARNEARRTCNFKEADRIREILKTRGIGLMDEPGGRGRGLDVTSWRVWR